MKIALTLPSDVSIALRRMANQEGISIEQAAEAALRDWLIGNGYLELEERCEFLAEMGEDLTSAFDTVGTVLDDKNTPKPIRTAIIVLLMAHADPARGKDFAIAFMEAAMNRDRRAPDGKDPISQSMSVLGRHSPALARQTHHVLATLSFGLMFLHLADSIRVERVRDEAAKDPVSLWARISRHVGRPSGNNDHHGHDGGLIHA